MSPVRRRQALALGGATLLGSGLAGCTGFEPPSRPAATPAPAPAPASPALDPGELPPPAPRELRAAWVASVANIDWPSRTGLAAEAMRAEALAMLDRARALGLNALILQVRPAGDALYPSTLEPWSEYLSGTQGQPPWGPGEPPWDPLAFWVREAHARALELHVWFNPFRARHSASRSALVAPHLGVRQPAVVKRYGDQLWMDPGDPVAQQHALAVVADVVRRYDIDAVHIDDYFYPYPVQNSGVDVPFPDEDSHARYRLAGGLLPRDDWRRANVDSFVEQFHHTVHGLKPWVRVGISPFGIGRPERRPPGITGFSQYDRLFADVERWLAAGWLDYLAPQLYWPIDRTAQAFAVLLDQWIAENTMGRHIWPGLFTSQVTRGEPLGPRSWAGREIVDQVLLTRTRGTQASGHIHFSMVALMQDRDGVATQLRQTAYTQPALVPATPWLDEPAPGAPTLRPEPAATAHPAPPPRWRIEPAPGAPVQCWAVWRRVQGAWRFAVLPREQRLLGADGADRLAVAAIGRTGLASAQHLMRLTA